MKHIFRSITFVIVGLASHPSLAATYECEVLDAMEVGTAGRFERDTNMINLVKYVGNKFTVDSETGVVVGGLINNRRGNAKAPLLLGKPDGKYHHVKIFTLIPEMGANFPFFIEIKDQLLYPDKSKIPFSGYFLSEVFSGLCRRAY